MDTKPNWGCLVFFASFGILLWQYPKTVLISITVFILAVMLVDCSSKSNAVDYAGKLTATAHLTQTGDPNGPDVTLTVVNNTDADISTYTFECGTIEMAGESAPKGSTTSKHFGPWDYTSTGDFLDIPSSAGTCVLTAAMT